MGLVHHHFDSVEALLVAAAMRVARDLSDDIGGLLDDAGDVGAGVDALVSGVTARRRARRVGAAPRRRPDVGSGAVPGGVRALTGADAGTSS